MGLKPGGGRASLRNLSVDRGGVVPSITSTNGPVVEGNTLDVTVDVTNNGYSQSATVELVVDGTQRDSSSLSLNTGQTQSETLSWATQSGDDGTYTATVSTADAQDSTGVSVASSVPNSAIHRWKYDEGSGGSVADDIGSASGTISGASWVSGSWQGSTALDGDGTDDYVNHSWQPTSAERTDMSIRRGRLIPTRTSLHRRDRDFL